MHSIKAIHIDMVDLCASYVCFSKGNLTQMKWNERISNWNSLYNVVRNNEMPIVPHPLLASNGIQWHPITYPSDPTSSLPRSCPWGSYLGSIQRIFELEMKKTTQPEQSLVINYILFHAMRWVAKKYVNSKQKQQQQWILIWRTGPTLIQQKHCRASKSLSLRDMATNSNSKSFLMALPTGPPSKLPPPEIRA